MTTPAQPLAVVPEEVGASDPRDSSEQAPVSAALPSDLERARLAQIRIGSEMMAVENRLANLALVFVRKGRPVGQSASSE
jgi:hypothetical protein